MSEQNTQDQAVETNGQAADTPAKLYPTKEEALAAKPADAPKSLKAFEVAKDGAVLGFMLGRGYDPCLAALARRDGYSVSMGGKTPVVTVEAAVAKLATLSDEELKALGLQRKKGR
jgi:hypothetical protein